MYAEYNGVKLKVVDLQRYERKNVYSPDGVDVLRVSHVIGLTCVLAPGGGPPMPSVTEMDPYWREEADQGNTRTAPTHRANPSGNDPDASSVSGAKMETDTGGIKPLSVAHSGPESDIEIRYKLLQPRKLFRLIAYSRRTGEPVVWLEAPRVRGVGASDVSAQQTADIADPGNGPFPLQCSPVAASGEPHSVGLYFEIECFTSPCPAGSDRLIVSHRWEMTHQQDDNGYLTRVIDGQVVFDRSILSIHPALVPDDFRNQFLHPIPVGFRRSLPVITQSSDGLTIRYVIQDADPTIVFSPGDSLCTQIDIEEEFYIHHPMGASHIYGTAS